MASLFSLAGSFIEIVVAVVSPRVHLKESKPKKKYTIKSFKEVTVPKTGRAVKAILEVPEKGANGKEYNCFLPKRFSSVLTTHKIQEFNMTLDLCLWYLGIGANREYIVVLVPK